MRLSVYKKEGGMLWLTPPFFFFFNIYGELGLEVVMRLLRTQGTIANMSISLT